MYYLLLAAILLVLIVSPATTFGAGPWPDLPDPKYRFTTFFVAWHKYGTEEFIKYVNDAKPEIVQVGFYGPLFHGYAFHEKSVGYPMNLPVSGEKEALAFQTELNRKIHEAGSKVIGHFQMCNVVEKWDAPYGFVKWYNELWDENIHGPKPVEDVLELFQRDKNNKPLTDSGGYIDFMGLCISNPHVQTMLKRMIDIAIDSGVDGLMSNYNYRWGCVCQYCQKDFKSFLKERYDAAALKDKFGIDNLDTHVFEEIPVKIFGYPDPATATELHWAAMQWGARQYKQIFDKVLVEHARARKPDFIIGSWDHMSFSSKEERAFTPIESWHKGENYFWYSGSHGTSNLKEKHAGSAWVNLLWLREMVQGKPFMIGKYESQRVRVGLAEGVATGGGGTGLRHFFDYEHGAKVMARHHNFVHDHQNLYQYVSPSTEIGMVIPRQSVLNRHPEPYDSFRVVAESLSADQRFFDVVLDQRITAGRLANYKVIILPEVLSLSSSQRDAILAFAQAGGHVLVIGEVGIMDQTGKSSDAQAFIKALEEKSAHLAQLDKDKLDSMLQSLDQLTADQPLSRFDAPWTVRASAFHNEGGMVVHLVNYNRDEDKGKDIPGPEGEMPIAVQNIKLDLRLPEGARIKSITLLSPEVEKPLVLPFEMGKDRVTFTVPSVEVYGVLDIRFGK